MKPAPMKLRPHFSPRPWGGTLLRDRLGMDVPGGGEPTGEAWTLSDHPNGRSVVASGPMEGRAFGDAVREYPREMLGRDAAPGRYPLLVKIIDAAQDLSIQVHPDDAYAKQHGDRGKTECWYVIACEPGTEIIYGLREGMGLAGLKDAAAHGTVAECVARYPVEPGQFLFVPPGTVHAILGGTMICEIQQSSDTTYRLWDWGRRPARPLHFEECWETIDFGAPSVPPTRTPPLGDAGEATLLTDNAFFRVWLLDVAESSEGEIPAGVGITGLIVSCVAGAGEVWSGDGSVDLAVGECVFVPAGAARPWGLRGRGDRPLRVLLAESREL